MGPLYRDLADRLENAVSDPDLEAVAFDFDARRAELHASEERLFARLLEARRETVAETGAGV
jgi:hypothetical protein